MSRISTASRGALAALAALAAILLMPRAAWAYRPFEQTDADVADLHCIELELGPVALRRSPAELVLAAPSLVVNYGIAPGVELVVEGQAERSLRPSPRASLDAKGSCVVAQRPGAERRAPRR